MSDPRPLPVDPSPSRPQYGEYATPEEQSRRAGRPVPPAVVPALPAETAPAPVTGASEVDAERPARPVDRMASIALLAYGLWNVITSLPAFLNPSSLVTSMMQAVGASGSFSNYGQARAWGIVAGVILIVGWIATAAWSVLRLRRGKLTWWLPVAGGVVFVTVATVCMMVPFFSDPAVISSLYEQLQK